MTSISFLSQAAEKAVMFCGPRSSAAGGLAHCSQAHLGQRGKQ